MKSWKASHKILFASAMACFLLAIFFFFALVGYAFTAYTLCAAGLAMLLYLVIGRGGGRSPRRALILRRILTALVVLGVCCFIAVEIPIVAAARTDKNPEADYLVVMGAGVNGLQPSLSMLDRLTAALEYLETYPDSTVIVSGAQGPGEDITEAEAMRIWLEGRGIAPERIVKEEKSRSSYENIAFSLAIIEELGGDATGRVAFVSSEYHLYRTKYLASEQGCDPVGVAGKTSYPVLMVNYFIREAFAVAYMWVF